MANAWPWTIRRLHAPDVASFREMNSMFGQAFEDIETYGADPPSEEYLRAFLERGDTISLAAFADGRVVGGLVAYVLSKFEQERKEIYIYDLAVALNYRRRGIARALIAALKDASAEVGAYVIFVQADPWDGPAIALYESLGAGEDVLHFDIEVRRA
jgi:aminoglycoside 3-N-acetyltransferase I